MKTTATYHMLSQFSDSFIFHIHFQKECVHVHVLNKHKLMRMRDITLGPLLSPQYHHLCSHTVFVSMPMGLLVHIILVHLFIIYYYNGNLILYALIINNLMSSAFFL